ncbi:MAG TPA: Mur ligase domain-containing protein [Kiritimatiellia bacterium]|nr:Mur ligase domain-containing protein [Kiritimatiellia bacterium]
MTDQAHVHVAGVAGVGMSALAQALLDAGYRVSGSDRYLDQGQDLEVLQRLRLAGVSLFPQDGSGILPTTAALAVSTAIERDNPDLAAAHRLEVPVVHRAEMLARLTAGKRVLAVTGTAGKTTVTGMIGHLCAEAGWDPVVVNGGVVNNWRAEDRVGNVRRGGGDVMILEADESDRSLLAFSPEYTVITNVTKDHFELEEVVRLFREFRDKTTGWTLLGRQAAYLLDGAPMAELTVESRRDGRWLVMDGRDYPVPMPGMHNAENTWIAIQAATRLGVPDELIRRGLATFRGIHRRLEVVGRANGIVVLDDYAHNPAKIAASWLAAAEQADRVIGIWRPHGYGPLALLFDELVAACVRVARPQDQVIIMPVYYAGGTAKKTGDAERLVDVMSAQGVAATFAPSYEWLTTYLRAEVRPGDVVLGMGARDPELPVFLHGLLAGLPA